MRICFVGNIVKLVCIFLGRLYHNNLSNIICFICGPRYFHSIVAITNCLYYNFNFTIKLIFSHDKMGATQRTHSK